MLIEILYNDKIEMISKLVITESNQLSLPKSIQTLIHKKEEYWIRKKIDAEKKEIK
jgi:hypothetical protein